MTLKYLCLPSVLKQNSPCNFLILFILAIKLHLAWKDLPFSMFVYVGAKLFNGIRTSYKNKHLPQRFQEFQGVIFQSLTNCTFEFFVCAILHTLPIIILSTLHQCRIVCLFKKLFHLSLVSTILRSFWC